MLGRGLTLGITVLLVGAPAASADTLFVSGDGFGSECTEDNSCDLHEAVETFASDGDEVVLLPGSYDLGSTPLLIGDAITIRPSDPGPRPLIFGTAGLLVQVTNGATLRDLRFLHPSSLTTGSTLFVRAADALIERVSVRMSGATGGVACNVQRGTLRDSSCYAFDGGAAAGSFVTSPVGTYDGNLVNVTALAGGSTSSYGVQARAVVGDVSVSARNVIASGFTQDVYALDGGPGTDADVLLSSSNFSTADADTSGGGASVTLPGAGDNQTGEPLMVHSPGFEGDFHQLAGSPTINAGAPDPLLGSLDFDFEPRTQGSAPDIGADEFTEASPPPPPDSDPPETTIDSKPKKKVRTKKKKAKYAFAFSADEAATFRCSLDGAPAAPCASPLTGKVKKGKHNFSVFAVDTAGNVDPTPAAYTWKVKRKKRKR